MAAQCVFWTPQQFADAVASGWTIVGGPYDNEEDCTAACEVPPPITTTCCPDNPVPQTITLTISGGTSCDGDYPLVYDEGNTWWSAGPIGGCTYIHIYCDSAWYMDVDGITAFEADSATCDPFEVIFNGAASLLNSSCGCTGGSGVITLSIPG